MRQPGTELPWQGAWTADSPRDGGREMHLLAAGSIPKAPRGSPEGTGMAVGSGGGLFPESAAPA